MFYELLSEPYDTALGYFAGCIGQAGKLEQNNFNPELLVLQPEYHKIKIARAVISYISIYIYI